MLRSKKIVYFIFLLLLASCANHGSSSWSTYIDSIGTYSSPRTVDLNNDQIPDIILGAGGREERPCDKAVLAIDGANGKVLWAVPGINQYVGSAIFTDITNDRIPDVFIGGRWAQLIAIDGATGKTIWTFYPERKTTDGSDGGWYNFTTPQFIPDQDGDGLEDILIANGGDARKVAGDTNRPAGKLLVINSKKGNILASVTVPDGKETYMSVVTEKHEKDIIVYFGTGGETIGGHLYRTNLKNIMKGDVSQAEILATSKNKGFVASPVLIDISSDGVKDIVINVADGRMLAFNGTNGSLIWTVELPGTEAYSIPAPGQFTGDSIPDFFSNFAIGVFPALNYSIRFMVNGKTGKIEYQDTIPAFQYASPVAADLDGDGYDEAIVNQSALKRKQFEDVYFSYLLAFDFKRHQQYPIGDTIPATNLASTPLIGDLDKDGMFDVIYTAVKYHDVHFDLEQPLGLWVRRLSTQRKIARPPRWGGFMGRDNTGVF